jgi:hypothetical protein
MSERRPPPPECAQCGATIPSGASACPECGADERTGWREASIYDGMDLPESAWSDEANEATTSSPSREAGRARRVGDVNGIAWYWWCAGVGLLFILGLGALALL